MFHQSRTNGHRRLSTASTCSAWSSDEHTINVATSHLHNDNEYDDDDHRQSAMASRQQDAGGLYSRRQSSAGASERSCEGLTAEHTKDLWRCMLELQERYGCYNSTRIDLAMEAGEDGVSYMPNRFIIDTLNESVIDLLPEEGWEMLEQCLHHEEEPAKKSSNRIWKAFN